MEKTVFTLSMVELIELQLVNSKDFLAVISQHPTNLINEHRIIR